MTKQIAHATPMTTRVNHKDMIPPRETKDMEDEVHSAFPRATVHLYPVTATISSTDMDYGLPPLAGPLNGKPGKKTV